jgi:hypothetical protein
MKNLSKLAPALLAVSLLCGTVAANATTQGDESPLLGKNSTAVALNDSAMDKVVGSGTYADSYGAYAYTYYYNAYTYASYARYSYSSGSSTSAMYYAYAGFYGGIAGAYASMATYYAAYGY